MIGMFLEIVVAVLVKCVGDIDARPAGQALIDSGTTIAIVYFVLLVVQREQKSLVIKMVS